MRKLVLILIAFWMLGCEEKPTPPETTGDPVFFARGEMEGKSFEWLAGEDELYMFTAYSADENWQAFSGYISKEDCETDCSPQLKFTFYEPLEEASAANLKKRDVSFVEHEKLEVYAVNLEPDVWTSSGNPDLQFEWDLDGEELSSNGPLTHYVSKSETGISVCMDVQNLADNSRSSICQDILWNDPCHGDFIFKDQGGFYSLEVENSNSSDQYSWAFGSGRFADGPVIDCEYGERAVEKVCMTTISGSSCSSTTCRNLVLDSTRARCSANLNFSFSEAQIPGPELLKNSRVLIEYTDEAGRLWTSSTEYQAAKAYFEILDAEDYDIDKNGNKTKKLELLFSCDLHNNGDVLKMEDFHASIAVALP